MQINLSAGLSGSTAEPAAGSAERTDKSPADSFFAQIDQVLNAGKEQEETAQAEKPGEQASSTAEADSLALILNSFLAAGSLQASGADIEYCSDQEGSFVTDTPITAAPEVPKGVTAGPSEFAGTAAADSSTEKAQVPRNVLFSDPGSEHRPAKAQNRQVLAQPVPAEKLALNRTGLASEAEWSEVAESMGSADKFQSDETTLSKEKAQETAATAKSEYFAQLEYAGAANPEAGRDGQRSSSTANTVLSNGTKGLQAGGEINAAPGEQLEFSSQLTSVHSRPAFTDSPSATAKPGTVSQQPGDFILQLAERIRFQLHDGKGEIRIQLKPDALGRLEIRAESSLNGVIARIFAESSAVKNYLDSNLHMLQQNLQEQGLKIDRIQVSVHDGFGSPSSAGYAFESGYTGPGYEGRGDSPIAPPDVSPANPQEEWTADQSTWISLNPNVRFHTIA